MTIEDLASKIDKLSDSVNKRFDETNQKIENEVGNLATMSKREFDQIHEEIGINQKQMLVHDFKMTEMVHKADHYKLEERTQILEKKVLGSH